MQQQEKAETLAHPFWKAAQIFAGPAGEVVQGAYAGGKRILGELTQAGEAVEENNPAGVGVHAVQALPFVGEGIKTGAEQLGPGEYINLPEAATALGTAATAAPMLMGGEGGTRLPETNYGVYIPREPKMLPGVEPPVTPEYVGEPAAPSQGAGIPDAEVEPWLEPQQGQIPAKAGPGLQPPPPVNRATAIESTKPPAQFAPRPDGVPNRGAIVDAQGNVLVNRPGLPPPGETAARKTPIIPKIVPPPAPVAPAPPQPTSNAVMVSPPSNIQPAPESPQAAPQTPPATIPPSVAPNAPAAPEAAQRPAVQASGEPAELRKSAQDQKPILEQAAQQVAAAVPGAEVVGPRVKSTDSIENKDDRGKPPETNVDNLGVRVVAPNPDAVPAVQQAIESQLPVVSKDKIDNNGLNLPQYGIQTGKPGEPNQVSELQVVPGPAVAKAMKDTDPLYAQQKEAQADLDAAKSGTWQHKAAQKEVDDLGAQIKAAMDKAKAQDAKQPENQGRAALSESKDQTQLGNPAPAKPLTKGTPVTLKDGTAGTIKGGNPNEPNGGRWMVNTPKGSVLANGKDITPADATANVPQTPPGPALTTRVEQIKALAAKGTPVKIFTARAGDPEVTAWVQKNGLGDIPVTNVKGHDFGALLDNEVNVSTNQDKPFEMPEVPAGKALYVDLDGTLAKEPGHEQRISAEQPAGNAANGRPEEAQGAIQKQPAAQVDERQPGQGGREDGGRVQPVEQGSQPAGESAVQAKPGGEENRGKEVASKPSAVVNTIAGKMDLDEFERNGYAPEQVTREDWTNLQRAARRAMGQSEESGTRYAPYADYEGYHKSAVEAALKKGEEVDPEVLKDYPDLKPAAAKAVEKAAPAKPQFSAAARAKVQPKAEAAPRELTDKEYDALSDERRVLQKKHDRIVKEMERPGNAMVPAPIQADANRGRNNELVKVEQRMEEIAARMAEHRAAEYAASSAKPELPTPKVGDTVTVRLGGRDYPNTTVTNIANGKYGVDVFGFKYVDRSDIVDVKPKTFKVPVVDEAHEQAKTDRLQRDIDSIQERKPTGAPFSVAARERAKVMDRPARTDAIGKPGVEVPAKYEPKPNESSTVATAPKKPESLTERFKRAQQAKADKYLDTQVRRESGQVLTRRQIIDERMAGGGTTSIKQVQDDAAERKLDRELGAMRRAGVPTGNQSHPTTIKYNELRAQQKAGIKVPSYRIHGADGTEWVVSKTEHDYAQSVEGKEKENAGSDVHPVREPGGRSIQEGNEGGSKKTEPLTQLTKRAAARASDRTSLGSTFYTGFADPQLFNRLFPDIGDRMADWLSDAPGHGDTQRAMMRETRGEMDRKVAIAIHKLKDASKEWRTRTRDDSMKFWNAVESGTVDTLAPRDQALANLFKGAFDSMRGQLQELKPEVLQDYIENYFPHIWERPSQVSATIKALITGKKPFAGKGSFLKQRTIPTMQDGIDLGFKPVSWNPVDSFLTKYAEMAQFLMGHQTLKMMQDSGTAKMVRIGKQPPEGWTQLDDRIGTVQNYDDDGHLYIRGHYYAPAEAARIFNNFVSRGMAGRSTIYDTLNWANQNLNALQLGISAFHASTTSINAATSDVALGIQQLAEGKPLRAGFSLAKGASVFPSLLHTMVNGSRLMREYLTPGSYAKMAEEAKALASAGGRIRQNTIELKPLDKVINAWRNGAVLEGLTPIPAAILHAAVAPVMDFYVPRMKLGAFYGMAHDILDSAQKQGWSEGLTRSRMQEAWDSIDNRFGQVVYDNLFWHKGVRDALNLATRSVGWNFGSYRELGGAVADVGRQAGRAASGQIPRVTPRLAFGIALPLVSALFGGILSYLWTGKRPQTWKDYFYPETANGQRHSIPGYMKDVFSFAHDPIKTALNKMAPIWEATAEAINNRDFYGTEIRHKDDPLMAQLGQFSRWAGSQAVPFSVSGTAKLLQQRGAGPSLQEMLQEAKKHPGDVALGQLGFQPAPAFIQNSEAINQARQYSMENRPPGTKTQDQAAHYAALDAVVRMYREDEVDQKQIDKYVDEGKLTDKDVAKAERESDEEPIARAVKNLTIEQMLNVWAKATADEREAMEPILERHEKDIDKVADDEQREKLYDAFDKAMGQTDTAPATASGKGVI